MLILMRRVFGILALAPFVVWVLALALTLGLTHLAGCRGSATAAEACRFAGADLSGLASSSGFMVTWGLLTVMPLFFISGALWFVTGWLRNNHW